MIKWQDTDLGTTGLDTYIGRGAVIDIGGKMVPIIPIIAGASFGLQSIYNVGKARDTRRYWADYYRNTGFRPRYAYRSGMYDWMLNDTYLVAGMTRFGRKSRYYR